MDIMSASQELKIHSRVAREHFKKLMDAGHSNCMSYGNKEDVVECLRTSGEIVSSKAEAYLHRNSGIVNSLNTCLQMDAVKNSADRKECVANVKAQINKMTFE